MPEVQSDIDFELSVSEFVALFNQTINFAFPSIVLKGELANFRVSKNQWIYFDLKDETASVKFFGTVYMLPGPLEDGMLLRVRGQPRLHSLYGFSITVQTISPAGEGTIKRAAELLKRKLAVEGLFDGSRKRTLPYPPSRVGLVTSKQSAAYADFMKILNARWQGVTVQFVDVQVQGEIAPHQISKAVEGLNALAKPPEVIVVIRGGGSPEDLAAFSTERVTRAVAVSRVPTLVAIGHEIDVSLAELSADQRASTPSNAAELLTPDRKHARVELQAYESHLRQLFKSVLKESSASIRDSQRQLLFCLDNIHALAIRQLEGRRELLLALSPKTILRRGYAIIHKESQLIRRVKQINGGDTVNIQLYDGNFMASIIKRKDNL